MKIVNSILLPCNVFLAISSFLLISLFSCASPRNVGKKTCQTKECLAAAKYLRESMNFDADPCDDFYKYACGNFSTVHPGIESSMYLRYEQNVAEIVDFLKQNNSNEEPEAVHKARKFFHMCAKQDAYSNNLDQILTILQKIGLRFSSLNTGEIENFDYITSLARAARFGVYLYFTTGVTINPYNQTVNTIGLSAETLLSELSPVVQLTRLHKAKMANITKNELNYSYEVTKRMCVSNISISCQRLLLPLNIAKHLKIAKDVKQKLEIPEVPNFIDSELDSTLNSSIPIQYTLKQLQALTDDLAAKVNATIPTLNWTRYFEEFFSDLNNVTLNLSDPNKVIITIDKVDSLKNAIQLFHKNRNINSIAYELLLETVNFMQSYVDSQFYGKERDCVDLTVAVFGMAVSYVYSTKEKYTKSKAEIRSMFENIREALQQLMQQASWMDEMTRQRALKKLHSVKSLIGFPNTIKTTPSFLNNIYSHVQVTDNLYDTMIRFIQEEIPKELKAIYQINNPRKNEDWNIPPSDVNAYYLPEENTIVVPAAIIDFPFNNNGLYALDYGSTGAATLGHELTHAFDNFGRFFNEIGHIEDWWQPETTKLFNEKAKCFIKAYSNFSVTVNASITLMVNSKKTLEENFSDNVGFKESILAYRKYVSVSGEEPLLPQFENFSHEQLLTLSFANGWCSNPSFYNLEFMSMDPHSAPEFRVNGVLQNSKEFSEIWKCPKGSKMNPIADKCEIW